MAELAPQGSVDATRLNVALRDVVTSAPVSAVTTQQQETGLWAENFLAFEPNPKLGVSAPGTVAQYRRLLQLGLPHTTRPFRLADRVLFRALSKDDDPLLLGEFVDWVDDAPSTEELCRTMIRDGVCAALAEAGREDDPRLRGAAHKVASTTSAFLRSPLAEDPLVKRGSGWQLAPEACPPTWWSLATLAAMPSVQRERGGFIERLTQYLSQQLPDRSFVVMVGAHAMKSSHVLLGDPIELDAKGMPKDLPLALHFIELLSGLGPTALSGVASATTVFERLLEDLDAEGCWHPKNLRSQPKPLCPITYHSWPLSADDGDLASRQADITFRLALIAKRLGWRLEYA